MLSVCPKGRYGHSAVVYQDAMWVFGGSIYNEAKLEFRDDLWKFNFTDFLWTEITGNTPEGRHAHSAVVYQDAMWVFGGVNTGDGLEELLRFDFVELDWELFVQEGTRIGHSAAIYNGMMYVFGGLDGVRTNEMWTMNMTDFVWNPVEYATAAPSARDDHSAIVTRMKCGFLVAKKTNRLFSMICGC